MSDFPLAAWLAHIGWHGSVDPTPEVLTGLHRCHVHAVPFENLDPLTGRPVSIEPADLIEKIIGRHRGGYCFELNGLFLRGLTAIGFRPRPLCARPLISAGIYGPRAHQITLVECAGTRWLADVGFGGNGLIEAIPFEMNRESDQGLDRFRIVEDALHGYRLEHRPGPDWRPLYAFSLDPYLPADFSLLNFSCARSPDFILTRVPICVRTTATERRILVANEFKTRSLDGVRTSQPIETAADFRSILADRLGIFLPADFALPDPAPRPTGMREI